MAPSDLPPPIRVSRSATDDITASAGELDLGTGIRMRIRIKSEVGFKPEGDSGADYDAGEEPESVGNGGN